MNRSRFGITLLAALGVVAATLAGTALHTTPAPHVATRDQASFIFGSFPPEFDPFPAGGTQIDTITFMNDEDPGTPAIPVKSVTVRVNEPAGAPNPWTIGPNEDCRNAVIAPLGYCSLELTFTPIANQRDIFGEVDLTLADNSIADVLVGTTTDDTFGMPPTNPLQVNYGNVAVGTTTAPQTVTVHTDPFEPQMILSVTTVPQVGQPNAAGDYRPVTDTCTNTTLNQPNQTCTIGVTATPATTGNRPAFLDIAFCDPNTFPSGQATGSHIPPKPVPPGQELICGPRDGPPFIADHILVSLIANGVPPTSIPPGQTFTPTLAAFPAVAPGGRTTFVTGTGFPDNTTVILALVPLGTPTTADLTTFPGSTPVTTNGIGGFTQIMLIMPHTAPGQYEIMGSAGTANATTAFLVAPGIQEPPKFVNRH